MIKLSIERKPVNENIKRFRIEAKMTQKDLAAALGYKSPSTIAKIESGENSVDLKTCEKIAKVLNVSPIMLSGLQTDENNAGYISELYRRLPRNGKMLLIKQAEAIQEMFQNELDQDDPDFDPRQG